MQPSAIATTDEATGVLDLVLNDATLLDGRRVSIGIDDGRIAAITARADYDASRAPFARRILELDGRVVLPGFVEAHTHLDKALTLPLTSNQSGTLREAIEVMDVLQHDFTCKSVRDRARAVALRFVAAGTTALRTHVDVKTSVGLVAVQALLELREELRPILDLQLVALSLPLAGVRGATNRSLVEEALAMGVDVIGGCPIVDGAPAAHIDVVFKLAERFGVPIDLHVDESDSAEEFCLPYLAERTKVLGFQGRVVAGHCCSLAAVDDLVARRAIEAARDAGISVVTLPSANLYLQGRCDSGLVRRGLTRVRDLMTAGVPVCCGSDNIQDPFNPFGRGDQLLVANLFAHAAHLGSPAEQLQALAAVTSVPASTLNLHGYGLEPGAWADIVVLDTKSPGSIVAEVPSRRYVIKRGSIVSETRIEQLMTLSGADRDN